MSPRVLVYIAASYAAPSPADRAENVRRAVALARLATEQGYAPICVHPGIEAGAYGDDSIPEHRSRGILVCVSLVQAVADAGGELWVLLRDDGTESPGSLTERVAYLNAGGERVRAAPWVTWASRLDTAGVLPLDPEPAPLVGDCDFCCATGVRLQVLPGRIQLSACADGCKP